MKQEFYTLPLALDQVILQKELPKCSLKESVAMHLHLILTTALGELPGDEDFGCIIWNHEFDNSASGHKLKEVIRESVWISIKKYEKRVDNVRVDLTIHEEEIPGTMTRASLKKRIGIRIAGLLLLTNEKFSYQDSFFIGPLSY